MSEPRRILIVEDSPDDAELSIRALRRAGINLTFQRVETPEAMRKALAEGTWDLVIADYSMPRFNGLAALKMLRESDLDLPFILVSGTVGEDVAVEAMKGGADDYVLKSNLARLPLAVERELRDSEVRVERNRAEARYRSLVDRVPVGLFRISPEGDDSRGQSGVDRDAGISGCRQSEESGRRGSVVAAGGACQVRGHHRKGGSRPELRDGDTPARRQHYLVRAECARSLRRGRQSRHWEGVLVDVTSRKLAEEEANRARDRVRDLALETARLRSDFLASMSHEIRTPLTGIIGTGELLSRSDLTRRATPPD